MMMQFRKKQFLTLRISINKCCKYTTKAQKPIPNLNYVTPPKQIANKIPRAIRLLTEFGAKALEPTIVGGRYSGPMVPRRIAANTRKRALKEGTFGTWCNVFGGWLPEWDIPRKIPIIKPLKGHLNDRTRHKRADKITKALEGMPDRIKKYKQEVEDRKPKKDIAYKFKRLENLDSRR